MKFRNIIDYKPSPGLEFTEPSLTVPDQTMPLKTILDRYSRGMPIDGIKTPIYEGEEPMPDLRTLDLAEIQMLKQDVRNAIKRFQNEDSEQSTSGGSNHERAERSEAER